MEGNGPGGSPGTAKVMELKEKFFCEDESENRAKNWERQSYGVW